MKPKAIIFKVAFIPATQHQRERAEELIDSLFETALDQWQQGHADNKAITKQEFKDMDDLRSSKKEGGSSLSPNTQDEGSMTQNLKETSTTS